MLSISLRRTASMTGLMAAALALLVSPQVQAQIAPISLTNATQVRMTVAPNAISAVKQGGALGISGSGLTQAATALPLLTGAGVGPADADFEAWNGASSGSPEFTYAISGVAADASSVAVASVVTTNVPTTDWGYQEARASNGTSGMAAAISNLGAVTTTGANAQGGTLSVAISSTLDNGIQSVGAQRAATTSTDQVTYTAQRQSTSVTTAASGLDVAEIPVLAGMNTAGNAPTVTIGDPGDQALAGENFSFAQSVRSGQSSTALVASQSAVGQPAYGEISNTMGGTTSGVIGGATGLSTLTVTAGGTGTTSSLTVVNSFSVMK